MTNIKPKDTVIVDMGTTQEEIAVVYMTGPTIAACCSVTDGSDRFRVPISRLTKIGMDGNPIKE